MTRLPHLVSLVCIATTTVSFCAPADRTGVSAPFAVTQTTQIPGETLKAGEYNITIVDQLADRMIVRVDNKSDRRHAIFLGVPGTSAGEGGGPVLWSTGLNKTAALRGFNFADGKRVEFVYPKAEAAALAKANSAKVVAIDPSSEGHSAVLKNLSQDELSMVNLWMLSLTTAGADNKTPAILAQRYEGPVEKQPEIVATKTDRAQDPQVASVDEPLARLRVAEQSRAGSSITRKQPVIAQLPHTGSYLPLVWLVGMLSLLSAVLVRMLRSTVEGRKPA